MTERVDVLIVGSGFGGSITAFRLAELYAAAGSDPAEILVLERGPRRGHTDFEQSTNFENLGEIYQAIGGLGAQILTASCVGGGSALYFGASLRAPAAIFERRDHRPEDGPDRRMWPSELSRTTLDPYYRRAEVGLRVRRPSWRQVSKSGGLWAANLHAAGHTCDRVPAAINPDRCVNARWCHTGCVFGAKNALFTNYLASAEQLGVQVRPGCEVELIRQTAARPYRFVVSVASSGVHEIECKVLVLAGGAIGTSSLLHRSRPLLPSLSTHVGRHLGSNGDVVASIEYDPRRVRDVLGLRYNDHHRGRPVSTMTYDFFADRTRPRFDGLRFTLQEAFLPPLAYLLFDDGRAPHHEPSWWGPQKKDALASWRSCIGVLAMVEDTHDGQLVVPPPTGPTFKAGSGPVAVGTYLYEPSEQTRRARAAAEQAIDRICSHGKLGRLMRTTETRGSFTLHPLGGCRMADSSALGVADHTGAVYGYEGLYCIDSSIVPTSLCVNPSLTVAALAERNAELLARRGSDFGLPAPPSGLSHATPTEIVGARRISPLEGRT